MAVENRWRSNCLLRTTKNQTRKKWILFGQRRVKNDVALGEQLWQAGHEKIGSGTSFCTTIVKPYQCLFFA